MPQRGMLKGEFELIPLKKAKSVKVLKPLFSRETKTSKADAIRCFWSHFLLFCNTLVWLFSGNADLADEIMEIIKMYSTVCRGLVFLFSGYIFSNLIAAWWHPMCFIRTLGFNQYWVHSWQTAGSIPRTLKPNFPSKLCEYQKQTSALLPFDRCGFRWQFLWN